MSKKTGPQLEGENKAKPDAVEEKIAGSASRNLSEAVDDLMRDGATTGGSGKSPKKLEPTYELALQTQQLYPPAIEAQKPIPEVVPRKADVTLRMPQGDPNNPNAEELREENRGDFNDKNPAPQGRWVNYRVFSENTDEFHSFTANGRSTKIVCQYDRWEIKMHGQLGVDLPITSLLKFQAAQI